MLFVPVAVLMPEMPLKEEHEYPDNTEKKEQVGLVSFLVPYPHGLIQEKSRYCQICKFNYPIHVHGSSSMICTPVLDLDRKLLNS